MASKKRIILPKSIHHVYNRAANKRTIFHVDKDFERFCDRFIYFEEITKVKVLAYCVLPNHYHFLVKEPSAEQLKKLKFLGSCQSSVSQFISRLEISYAKYYNNKYDHSGVIFQGIFNSVMVEDDDHLKTLFKYIENNPVKHGLVENSNDYIYCSRPTG